jgi:hypothetical protein
LVTNGELTSGVVDQEDDGYIAGSFEHGRVVRNEDRQSDRHGVISAFVEAVAAAEEEAKRFEKAGNNASARFYQAKAKALPKRLLAAEPDDCTSAPRRL